MKRYFAFAPIMVVCIALAIVATYIHGRPVPYMNSGQLDYSAAVQYWKQKIPTLGEDAAHTEFIREGDVLPDAQAHELAHAYGAALFDIDGAAGIKWCGVEFFYGCYHQLIGSAIVQMGTSVIPQLYATCAKSKKDAFGCEHGIGHGLVGYFGYTQSDLTRALDLCSSLDPSPMSGCLDGAFMEYNLRELALNADGTLAPRLMFSDAYSPCDSLPIQYKEACVFELPNWWESVAGQPTRQTFEKIGSYCDSMRDLALREICDEGEGYVLPPPANSDSTQVESMCGAGTRSERDIAYCIAGVAWRDRFSYGESPAAACQSLELSGKALSLCIAFASLPRGSTSTVPF